MIRYFLFIATGTALYLFIACGGAVTQEEDSCVWKEIELRYATRFKLYKCDSGYKIQIVDPYQKAKGVIAEYLLFADRDESRPDAARYPLRRVVCMSTTHLGFLELLDSRNCIYGISGCKYVFDSLIRKMISQGKIAEIGYENQLDYERLVIIQPDAVIAYGINAESLVYIRKMEELGLKVILNGEYLEESPLARAEWIKFFGVLTGKYDESCQIFNRIDSAYQSLSHLMSDSLNAPWVMAGLPWKDEWWVSGGRSYIAHLIQDAGGSYVWQNDSTVDGFPSGLEYVMMKAAGADIWLNPGSADSKDEILKTDSRMKNFLPFQNDRVFNCTKRMSEGGGNDYWESGVARPDLILKDMLYIISGNKQEYSNMKYFLKLE